MVCNIGDISAPTISRVSSAMSNKFLANIIVERPTQNAICVQYYNVSVNNGKYITTIPVSVDSRPPPETQSIYIGGMNVSYYNPCKINYTFQVQAANSMEQSNVEQGTFNFSGKILVSLQ